MRFTATDERSVIAYVALRKNIKMVKIALVTGRYDRDNFRRSSAPGLASVRSPLVPPSTLEPLCIALLIIKLPLVRAEDLNG
jgi:hypothetical protein